MKKSKKEKIISSIGFVVLLSVMAVTLSLFFKPANPMDYANVRRSMAYRVYDEPNNTLDVLFVGHSEIYYDISPMEMYNKYGFTSYCCSYALQMPWESADFLKEVLTKQTPQVVVFDIDNLFYSLKRTNIEEYYQDAVAQHRFPLLENHIAWKDWFPNTEERNRSETKGHAVKIQKRPVEKQIAFKPTDVRYPVESAFAEGFEEVVKICKEKGITLYLVELPNKVRWNYAKFNTATDYANKYGLEFTDFTQHEKQIGIDWENDTWDKGDHLNYFGVTKLNSYIGKILDEKYDLPDRRNDEKYAFWKDDYERYKELFTKAGIVI